MATIERNASRLFRRRLLGVLLGGGAAALSSSAVAQLPPPGTPAWEEVKEEKDNQWETAAALRFAYVSQVLEQEAPDEYAAWTAAQRSHKAATADLLRAIPDAEFHRAYGAPLAQAEDLLFSTHWLSLVGPFAMSEDAAAMLYDAAVEWQVAAAELSERGLRAAPNLFLRYQRTGLAQTRALLALREKAPSTFAEWNFIAHVVRRAGGYADIPTDLLSPP